MRIFVTRAFARFARKERIDDATLCETIARAERQLIDADLGGGVIKQRIARPGKGRSGGYRSLIAYRTATRSIFLVGFAKNEQDSIDADELKALRKSAAILLSWDDAQVETALTSGAWTEIDCDA